MTTQITRPGYTKSMGISVLDQDTVSIIISKPGAKSLRLNLYPEHGSVRHITIPAMKDLGMDDYFSMRIHKEGLVDELRSCTYDFSADGEHFLNTSAEIVAGRDSFGKQRTLRGRIPSPDFDWAGEKRKLIPSGDMVIYEAHVRGFTKHKSSGVAHPGTFDGMREKLPYLKKLGINTLFLLPIYDFNELSVGESLDGAKRVNYWGYTKDSFYFAPKASYSSDPKNPDIEFKSLVKEIHRLGMNIILDMFFGAVPPDYVLDCLRHYAVNYHIDGFRVSSDWFNINIVNNDPILRHVRFFGLTWDDKAASSSPSMLYEMNDGFKEIARRFVKSDEGQVDSFYHAFRMEKRNAVKVNYITAHDGFTLRDLISYDIKHNDANGEKNRDGTDYNYSWNCGFEGPTRRQSVLKLRSKQEKNILTMLLLGLPIPMLLMGDEFGNTQKGNNNAYCQDNSTTWLDWGLLDKNKETYNYVTKLLKLRKKLPMYHREGAFSGFDHKGLGAPDISNHSKEPWNHNYPFYCRELGILFYGPYLEGKDNHSYYIGFNMHWEAHDFYLPDITKTRKWEVVLDTAADLRKTGGLNEDRTAFRLEPRSIVLLSCPEDPPKPAQKPAKKPAEKAKPKGKRGN